MEERYNILKERAQSFQISGGEVSYLEVIFGSTSYGDFVNRLFALSKIMEADAELIEGLQASKSEVEEKKSSLENKLDELSNMKTELEGMQAHIQEQKEQNDLLKEQLQQKQQDNLERKAALQQEDSYLDGQESETGQSGNNQDQLEQLGMDRSDNQNQLPSNDTPTNSSGLVQDVTHAGYKYIGNSVYVFGGGRTAYDIANGRFDCSGFVHWAFSQAGISVGASTDSLKYNGRQVPASDMRPGDLVFFDTYKRDGHVGIYIGGGQFIGSQSSTGVAIANMTSGYWANRFNGRVVRIIN
jgi:cell wall-associated NlpC family hydrolase